jgi:putative ABC transport system permease protein
VSFVEGLNRYVTDKLINAGANVFVVDKWGFITSQEAWEDAMKRPDITLMDAEVLRDHVRSAALVIAQDNTIESVRYRTKNLHGVQVKGRSPGWEILDDVAIGEGRHLHDIDDQRRRLVCVIGPEIAEELFPHVDPLGREIRVGAHLLQVVGVSKPKGKVFGQTQDRFVAIPIATFQKYKRERGSIEIAIKTHDTASLPLAQQEVRNLLRGRHHLAPGKPDDFGITTADTWLDLYRNLTGGIFIVTIGVASIAMLVGGIVIMNIMLVSVMERTREIGVRKALGARRRDILTQVLIESATLATVGAIIGVAVGIGIAELLAALSPMPSAVAGRWIALGVGLGMTVGIVAGVYPASQASKLDPVDALRYE